MRQSPFRIVALAIGLAWLNPGVGQADPLSVYVPGIADPYLAGMPASVGSSWAGAKEMRTQAQALQPLGSLLAQRPDCA